MASPETKHQIVYDSQFGPDIPETTPYGAAMQGDFLPTEVPIFFTDNTFDPQSSALPAAAQLEYHDPFEEMDALVNQQKEATAAFLPPPDEQPQMMPTQTQQSQDSWLYRIYKAHTNKTPLTTDEYTAWRANEVQWRKNLANLMLVANAALLGTFGAASVYYGATAPEPPPYIEPTPEPIPTAIPTATPVPEVILTESDFEVVQCEVGGYHRGYVVPATYLGKNQMVLNEGELEVVEEDGVYMCDNPNTRENETLLPVEDKELTPALPIGLRNETIQILKPQEDE